MSEREGRHILYRCDPKKNDRCRKTACQNECFFTTHKEYRKDSKVYIYNYGIGGVEVKR